MVTHLRVLSESYSLNANMTGFKWFQKLCIIMLWMKVASALEGLKDEMGKKGGCAVRCVSVGFQFGLIFY